MTARTFPVKLLWLGILVSAVMMLVAARCASAAMEGLQEPGLELRYVRGWSVTLYVNDPAQYGWSHKRISGFYEERAACEKIKLRTIAKVKGGRLACDFTDELMMLPVRE